MTIDGRRIGRGRLELPAVGPRSSVDVELTCRRRSTPRLAVACCSSRFKPRRRGTTGVGRWPLGRSASRPIELGGAPNVRRIESPTTFAVEVTDDGIVVGGVVVGWPALSLWRAPTDNDDPPGEWRATTPAARLARRRARSHRRDGRRGSPTRRRPSPGSSATRPAPATRSSTVSASRSSTERRGSARRSGRSRAARPASRRRGVRVARRVRPAHVARPRARRLVPRPAGGDARSGGGRRSVGELAVPFVRPQEYGLHLDTEWFEVASPTVGIRVAGDRPLAFSALPALGRGAGVGDARPPVATVVGDPRPSRRRPPRPRHGGVRPRHPSPSPRPWRHVPVHVDDDGEPAESLT